MRRFLLPSTCVLASLLVGYPLSGCAGDATGAPNETGTLRVKVNWSAPDVRSKLIPASTQCLKLQIYAYPAPLPNPEKAQATLYDTTLVPRQAGDTTTVNLTLPVGTYYLTATAHSATDATDYPQALGTTGDLTVLLNGTTDCPLTLGGTVTSITLSPTLLLLYGGVGATDQIAVTARDAAENTIVLSRSAASWTVSAPNVVRIDTAGYATALVGSGSATVTYTDTEHNVTSNEITIGIPAY